MQSNSSATFVVHNLDDAKRALEIAMQSGTNVTLVSAPCAASLLGPRTFNEMISAAMSDVPCEHIRVDAILDCGDTAGPALRAIREGSPHILTRAPDDVARKISEMASASGVKLSRGANALSNEQGGPANG